VNKRARNYEKFDNQARVDSAFFTQSILHTRNSILKSATYYT